MLRLALRTLRFRKGGFIATFIAVCLGAAIVTASGGLMETGIAIKVPPQRLAAASIVVTGDQYYQVPNQNPQDHDDNDKTDALPERYWLGASLVDKVQSVQGVTKAIGETSFSATLLKGNQPVIVGTESLGHGWSSAVLAPYILQSGNAPTQADEVVLDAGIAQQAGVSVGAQVNIATGGSVKQFTVSGIASAKTAAGQSALFFSDAEVQQLNPHAGKLDAIGIFVEPGTDVEQVQKRIDSALSDQPIATHAGDGRGVAEFPEAASSGSQLIPLSGVFTGMALFVAMFVVATTLGLSIQQRQREMALLRAIGATPRQMRRMVIGEVFAVSIFAALIGCGLSTFLGPYMFHLVSSAGVVTPAVVFHQGFIPYLGGPAVMLLAALLAAFIIGRRAAKIRPTEALVEASVQSRWISVPRLLFAAIFFAGGIALFIVTTLVMTGPIASATAGPASMCWAISLALVAPGLTKMLTAVIRGPIRAVTGLAGYLATLNAKTRAIRMAGAVTPIMLAVGIATANMYTQTTQSAAAQDNYVSNLSVDTVLSSSVGGFNQGDIAKIQDTPGVSFASPYVTSSGWILKPYDPTHHEIPWLMQGFNAESAAKITGLKPTQGSLADLHGNTVALTEPEAQAIGISVGSTITLGLGDRETVDVRVVALYPTGRAGYETMLLPADLLAAHTTVGLPTQILVGFDSNADKNAVTAALAQKISNEPGVRITGRDGLTTFASGLQTQAWVNYMLVALIAGYTMISVANTLVMATAARKREFGLQRLIGFTRRQVIQMLSVEAILIAIVGIVLGTIASAATLIPFSLVVSGSPFPSGSLWTYLVIIGAAVLLAIVATLLPARRAMRSAPVEAAVTAE